MITATVDDKKRVRIPDARPGQVFSVEPKPGGFVLVEVLPKEVSAINPVRTKEDFLMWPVKVDRKIIAAAIRADRDAR